MNIKKIIDDIINGSPDPRRELDDIRREVFYRIKRKEKESTTQLSFINQLGGQECDTLKKFS